MAIGSGSWIGLPAPWASKKSIRKSGTAPCSAHRSRSSSATSSETSRDHPSSVLNATTRTGLLRWPSIYERSRRLGARGASSPITASSVTLAVKSWDLAQAARSPGAAAGPPTIEPVVIIEPVVTEPEANEPAAATPTTSEPAATSERAATSASNGEPDAATSNPDAGATSNPDAGATANPDVAATSKSDVAATSKSAMAATSKPATTTAAAATTAMAATTASAASAAG
jgi:hypothetical protein